MPIDLKATTSTPAGVRDALGLPISVKVYGAVGDGATDDTDAIQAALAAVPAAGGLVYFPPGTYLLDETIELRTGVRVVGAGKDATYIKAGAGFPTSTPMVTLSDATTTFNSRVEHLTLDCNSVSGSIGVLSGNGQEGSGLLHVRVWNYRDCGFRAESGGGANSDPAEMIVEGCEFWGSASGSNYGLDFDTCNGAIYVSDTTILPLSGTGPITAGARVATAEVHFRNIHIEGYADGIYVDIDGFVQADGVQGGNGPGADGTHAMVHVESSTSAGGVFTNIRNVTGNIAYFERYSKVVATGDFSGARISRCSIDNTTGLVMPRTDSVYLPAAMFLPQSGLVAGDLLGTHGSGAHSGWSMAAGAVRHAVTMWTPPSDWAGCSVDLEWLNNGAGSGNVNWNVEVVRNTLGTTGTATAGSTTDGIIAASAQDVPEREATFVSALPLDQSLYTYRISVYRNTTSDTLANDVLFMGLRLNRTS